LQSRARNGSDVAGSDQVPDLFLRRSFRNIRRFLGTMTENNDSALLATANAVLGKEQANTRNGQ
jgi:hypothetical protein